MFLAAARAAGRSTGGARRFMASRVLLLSPNWCRAPDPVFPLGLAHLNAALRRAGHQTSWFDCLLHGPSVEERLAAFRPDFVGISVRNIDDVLIRKRETFFDGLKGLVAAIRRQARCPVILGGSGFSIFPQSLMELAEADFGICGEGDRSLVELLEALNHGAPHSGIPGLVFRHNGQLRVNPPAGPTAPLELREADRPAPITEYYLRTSGMLNLQTQRGCAFHCCYCTYPQIEGRRHYRRPAEIVAEEFEQLQRLGARHAFIVDAVFNSCPEHVAEVCQALLRRQLKITWSCFLRPQGLTAELVKLMARAGLTNIEFGSDSLCDEVLAAYQKDLSFDDILQASALAAREHIDYCHFLICGGPGETRQTLRLAFDNSRRLPGAVFMAVVGMRIYPGTPLSQRALADGLVGPDHDLLRPTYYVAPQLTADEIFAQLQEFARRQPNWVAGDPTPAYLSLVERLRQRGIIGPLWSYFSLLQRLWPPSGTHDPHRSSAAPLRADPGL
jgi:radical SAM superfamily enzyme YgiQ (UPF0313 family)